MSFFICQEIFLSRIKCYCLIITNTLECLNFDSLTGMQCFSYCTLNVPFCDSIKAITFDYLVTNLIDNYQLPIKFV